MQWLNKAGFFKHICWAEKESSEKGAQLPDWATFLVWLGAIMRQRQIKDGRIICVALLPTRMFGSSLAALGALASSLTGKENEMNWGLFLECEDNLIVYFILTDKNGKKEQIEGELGGVIDRNGQKLRSIRTISQHKRFKNSTFYISESTFKDWNVAFHPHYRSRRLANLQELSAFFNNSLADFNENQLLMHDTESIIITNRAGWTRENEEVIVGTNSAKATNFLPLKEVLLTRFGRVLLSSPKSKELETVECPLAILDGLDALRSREFIKASNLLILLDQEEYNEEAEDICIQFSGYCLEGLPKDFDTLPTRCPDGIDVQLYVFGD